MSLVGLIMSHYSDKQLLRQSIIILSNELTFASVDKLSVSWSTHAMALPLYVPANPSLICARSTIIASINWLTTGAIGRIRRRSSRCFASFFTSFFLLLSVLFCRIPYSEFLLGLMYCDAVTGSIRCQRFLWRLRRLLWTTICCRTIGTNIFLLLCTWYVWLTFIAPLVFRLIPFRLLDRLD